MKLNRKMTLREYDANIQGIHMLFGAVLGFVLAGAEAFTTFEFAMVLLFTSGVVVGIFYVTASRHRLAYVLFSGVTIALLPIFLEQMIRSGAPLPAKLQPTLAVWLFMVTLVEFVPREPLDEPAA